MPDRSKGGSYPSKGRQRRPVLLIHGGAGPSLGSRFKEEKARDSLKRIVLEGTQRLQKFSAFETAKWAVTQLEDDPQFNAGTGGKLQFDGKARLSASIMNGKTMCFSGLINVENIKNPILVAARLQDERDRVLSGEGAQEYARKKGFRHYDPVTEEMWSEWQSRKMKRQMDDALTPLTGTVGALALDLEGNLAAATSTGGKGLELVGRVSDSGTVAGNYASRKVAVTATGVGEEIVEQALASKIAIRVEDGLTLAKAFSKSFRELNKHGGRAGAIGLDLRGNIVVKCTTDCILHAFATPSLVGSYP